MMGMFNEAIAFNSDISGWDTSSVEIMSKMFYKASAFNADISGWNTSSVRNMHGILYEASAFNFDISGWDTSSLAEKLEVHVKDHKEDPWGTCIDFEMWIITKVLVWKQFHKLGLQEGYAILQVNQISVLEEPEQLKELLMAGE